MIATTDQTPLRPRRVEFDWSTTPLHWIPNDPFATHLINAIHLLLPTGERWFVEVYREALLAIHDDRLQADVRGFMGQEAVHARAHSAVLDHLKAQGIDGEPYTRHVDWIFARLMGNRPFFISPRHWLRARLAIIAAIEHFTCVLGNWILDASTLDEAGADPIMLDLLRWHGAEEVEHASVAFDVLEHLGGHARYPLRVAGMLFVCPLLLWELRRGAHYLIENDTTLKGRRMSYREYLRVIASRRVPGQHHLIFAIPEYLAPSFHPFHADLLARALRYLKTSGR